MDWEATARGVESVASRAHPWAADAAVIILALCVGVTVVAAFALSARKLLGMGATAAEIEGLLERPIELLEALDRKVDGHAERIAALEGYLSHLPAWDGTECRRGRPGPRQPRPS